MTTLFVAWDLGSDQGAMLDYVNAALAVNDTLTKADNNVVDMHASALPDGWYGGTKYIECGVAVGAFNYLNLEAFISELKGIPFEILGCSWLQLIVMGQHDEGFRIIEVYR